MNAQQVVGQLGNYLLQVMSQRGMQPNDLRGELHISSAVLDQLFYYGEKPNIRQPKPNILRAAAQALDVDEKRLFSLAGYSANATGEQDSDADLYKVTTLGELIEKALVKRGISSNKLSELAGVSQGTIHNLLKQGRDSSVPGPHPRVLRSVCEVLDLDQLYVFQLVGYIDPNYQMRTPN